MKAKLRAYLDLVRLPNLFTAAADVFAGFFYVGGWFDQWSALVSLALASMCLYAGGAALNDVCDAKVDATVRPGRPIPSGRVTLGEALKLVTTLLIAGVALAAMASWQAGGIAVLIVAAIVLYNRVFKRTALASPLMGLCRGLNVALGMQGVNNLLDIATLRPIAIVGLYVTAVTLFARTEARQSHRFRLVAGVAAQLVAIAGLWTIWRWTPDVRYPEFGWLAAGLAVWIVYNGLMAIVTPSPAFVQRAVKRSVLSIIILDACIAWSVGGHEAALLTLALLVPAILFARMLRVT